MGVPKDLDAALSVLGSEDESRAASLETDTVIQANRPVYCEVSPSNLKLLETVKKAGCFAKIRTGGLKPEAIPTPLEISSFITACAELKLPFKATAGLHHPIRAINPLSYEEAATKAVMHGFLNVLMASAFAWRGERALEPIVAEKDAMVFKFDERAYWRNLSLSVDEISRCAAQLYTFSRYLFFR